MEKELMMKLFGGFVAVLMVISLFAVAFNYGADTDNEPNTEVDQSLRPSTFSYEVSFDTQVLQELSSLKFSGYTNSINIQEIDSSIQEIEGVRKVASQFQATGEEDWVYYAEITTKKGYSLEEIASQISSLNYFSGEKSFIKYVTVSPPDEPVLIRNETLDMNKQYSFEAGTISTAADLTTKPGDEISVTGNISLQNNSIIKLELFEYFNQTRAMEEIDLNETDFNQEDFDFNTDVDLNSEFEDDENIFDVVVDENSI